MCETLGRRFKFEVLGYGPEWRSTSGILQGCPISVLLLNLLMSVWGTRISSLNTASTNDVSETEPQGYADDCWVTTTLKPALCKAITECDAFASKTQLLLSDDKFGIYANERGMLEDLDDVTLSGKKLTA